MIAKEEKKERRIIKRKLRTAILKNYFKDWKFRATNNQLKQGAKCVADQVLAGRIEL